MKTRPFALFELACSTYENLTAVQFIERLHRQSERLARNTVRPEEQKTEDADIVYDNLDSSDCSYTINIYLRTKSEFF